MLLINNSIHKAIPSNNYIRDTKKFKIENFVNDLNERFSEFSKNSCPIDGQFENLIDTFQSVLNEHAPLGKKTKKENNFSAKPWLTRGHVKSSKTKNKLYITSLSGSNEEIERFKKYRNKFTHLLNESKHNKKLLWKNINDTARYKKHLKIQVSSLIIDSGKETTDQQQIGNTLNTHFFEIGLKLASKIESPTLNGDFLITSLITQKNSSFFLKPITIAEVTRYIKGLNPAKSAGPEGIPLKFIIMGAEIISPILVNLYNQCITTGTY